MDGFNEQIAMVKAIAEMPKTPFKPKTFIKIIEKAKQRMIFSPSKVPCFLSTLPRLLMSSIVAEQKQISPTI